MTMPEPLDRFPAHDARLVARIVQMRVAFQALVDDNRQLHLKVEQVRSENERLRSMLPSVAVSGRGDCAGVADPERARRRR